MSKLAIIIITFYQQYCSVILKQLLGVRTFCRYPLSCSEYAKQAIAAHGLVRGSSLGIKRLLSCQPIAKGAINNV
ncbi:MAG TPA: membrane protein insertion efficiency factor YidD [Patescibacteria group bacterium]|nr:membrane protein insertion efficiency factor YidD [Patescibacteria group bacterium]